MEEKLNSSLEAVRALDRALDVQRSRVAMAMEITMRG